MGLCKCPKKKVTNLFCFEHTVNVCEHCLISNHSRCVVQSYLQWLQDSDYDPACRLCGKNLSDNDCGPCVRLLCYDLFHWSCLDNYERSLPANTAPAGYTCPICNAGIFPATNVVSPVVDSLRQLLSTVNWARAGLGLPMLEDGTEKLSADYSMSQNAQSSAVGSANQGHDASTSNAPQMNNAYKSSNTVQQNSYHTSPVQSVIAMDEAVPYSRGGDRADLLLGPQSSLLNQSHDHDTDKYKRRPALQWFFRWFSSRTSATTHQRKDPNATIKRFFVLLLLGLIGFITIIIIFSRLGRYSTEDDPFLDPMANPNIRIQNE